MVNWHVVGVSPNIVHREGNHGYGTDWLRWTTPFTVTRLARVDSSDATLSDHLTLTRCDGHRRWRRRSTRPTTTYIATVASYDDVSTTVTATVTDTDKRHVEITPEDANDETTEHQVELDEGPNDITIVGDRGRWDDEELQGHGDPDPAFYRLVAVSADPEGWRGRRDTESDVLSGDTSYTCLRG